MFFFFGRYLDLHNQTTLDSTKLGRVEEYEDRIGALIKTLSIWFVVFLYYLAFMLKTHARMV
jgi:hypothetical protein